jgi:hypothetical protein
VGNS